MVAAEQGRCTLVTGPASSGKSLWAESLASHMGRPVIYLATAAARPDDADWQERLRRHRQRRPAHWLCREVGLELPSVLPALPADAVCLIDSLGTWVAAGLELDASSWHQQAALFCAALESSPAALILVAEETAWGVVPPTAIGLLFRDRLASLIQQLMPVCDAAWLVLHGRALDLMALSRPIGTPTAPL